MSSINRHLDNEECLYIPSLPIMPLLVWHPQPIVHKLPHRKQAHIVTGSRRVAKRNHAKVQTWKEKHLRPIRMHPPTMRPKRMPAITSYPPTKPIPQRRIVRQLLTLSLLRRIPITRQHAPRITEHPGRLHRGMALPRQWPLLSQQHTDPLDIVIHTADH